MIADQSLERSATTLVKRSKGTTQDTVVTGIFVAAVVASIKFKVHALRVTLMRIFHDNDS